MYTSASWLTLHDSPLGCKQFSSFCFGQLKSPSKNPSRAETGPVQLPNVGFNEEDVLAWAPDVPCAPRLQQGLSVSGMGPSEPKTPGFRVPKVEGNKPSPSGGDLG